MMDGKQFLVLINTGSHKPGSIMKCRYNEVEYFKTKTKNRVIELSDEEAIFYKKFDENVRFDRYKVGLCYKVKQLQKNYTCLLKIEKDLIKVKILDRKYKNGSIYFTYENPDGKIQEIPLTEITDVEETDIQDQGKSDNADSPGPRVDTSLQGDKEVLVADGFYILSRRFATHQCGVIIRVRDGAMTNIDDKSVIMNHKYVKDSLIKIEENQAKYLLKFPQHERLERKEKDKYSRIQNLQIGQECNLRKDRLFSTVYNVVLKNITDDGIKFDLRSQKNKAVMKDVDEAEITFSKKMLEKTSGSPTNSQASLGSMKYDRQGSKNSTSSFEVLNDKKNHDIPKTIFCGPINHHVINPIQIKKGDKDDGKILNKFIVINIKEKQSLVKLLWKGLVDEQICLGCDLLADWDGGTDGVFNDHKLFSCDNNRGVLIPIGDDIDTCESVSPKHKDLPSVNVIIEEQDICCLQTHDDNDIYMGKKIIADQEMKIKGICKWMGHVNGRECVGIDSSDWMAPTTYQRNGLVDTMKLFRDYCSRMMIFETRNIPKTLFCGPINHQVINPSQFKKRDKGDEKIFSKFIVINTKEKQSVIKLVWKGLVDGQIYLGCDLLADWDGGTDGVFNGHELFSCKDKQGVLIPESSLVDSCLIKGHRDIKVTADKYQIVQKETICCLETILNLPSGNIAIGKKLRYGRNKMCSGSCEWLGEINGEKCVGILDSENYPCQYHSDGVIRAAGICGDDYSKWAIITLADAMSLQFVRDIFLENTDEIDENTILKSEEMYKIGKFIQAGKGPVFYGPVEFFMKYFNDYLVGLKVNVEQIQENLEFSKNIKFLNPPFKDGDVGIIVKVEGTREFKEDVELKNNSTFINPGCIAFKVKHDIPHLKSGDIVKFIHVDSDDYFRVHNVLLLNNIPCLEISKATLIDASRSIEYVKADDIIKHDISNIHTRYIQGAIIDSKSVRVWESLDFPNLSVEDQVEFKMKITGELCKGIIKCTGKANGIPSGIVQRVTNFDKAKAYRTNEKREFNEYFQNDSIVIVPIEMLKKIREMMTSSGIPIMDPRSVETENGKQTDDRYITFKSNNISHLVLLKWKGYVNEIYCFGSEIDLEEKFGTNGTFAGKQLFKCKGKCGILTPLHRVTECCLNMKHNDLQFKQEKIIENSICCIKSKTELSKNRQINVNERLQSKKSELKGLCKWVGLVNNKEAIFLELENNITRGSRDLFYGKKLFSFSVIFGAFFDASEFVNELIPIAGIQLSIIDPFNTKTIENGAKICKIISVRIKQKKQILSLKWRGVVNGQLCVGCQLPNDEEYGSDGVFGGKRLFTCPDKRGVLIPVEQLGDSCESTGKHKDIGRKHGYLGILGMGIQALKIDCVCCAESLDKIERLPQLRIDSRVKQKDHSGTCKWIGLLNGMEVVGVEMDKEFKEATKGQFDGFDLFACEAGRGFIFMAEDIIHDKEDEKPHFVVDQVVDIQKIHGLKSLNNFEKIPFKIGDPLITHINTIGYIGELKWVGQINNEICVGLDLEDAFEYGMSGKIGGKMIFQCIERHGVITLLTKIQYHDDANKLQQFENGIINPNKYMKCVEQYDRHALGERNINKNDSVFVMVRDENEERKLKATLRWCGLMNGIPVGAVELHEDHKHGTDGRFWRHRLFQCGQKRAIAIPWDMISQYIPFDTREIPEDNKIFSDICNNSAVKYYYETDDGFKDLFGTVRWSGLNNETGEYLFGIELDDRIAHGTDGEFLGQRLFHCQYCHGILAPVNRVMKDMRFVEQVIDPVDVKQSEVSTKRSFGILTRLTEGENKGIQGNANSCYFDSAIFALFVNTDALDFMISPLRNERDDNDITKQFRDIMAWKIVYPLRENQFVSFHRTAEMRNIIQKYGAKFAEMMKHESDMENVSSLLSMLCPTEQLLSIVSFNNTQTKSMFLQLFLTIRKKVEYMTSEEMLKMSMVQNNLVFNELPSCLIFQAPRDAIGINCYEYVIPTKTIEISEICANHFRKCFKCPEKATFQCKECMERNGLAMYIGLYCDQHKCGHEELTEIPDFPNLTKSKVFLDLKAIICIEKCHFVAYINENSKWFFFDSMSTQSIANNYAVPKITFSKDVSDFLSFPEGEMKEFMLNYKTEDIKRVVKDSYVLIYHNSARTCY